MMGTFGLDSSATIHPSQPASQANSMEVLDAIAQNNITPGSGGSVAGNVIVSPFGELIIALIQMQMQNAAIFKQTAAQASARAQQEAQQQASAESKQFLNNVANALQEASQTGNLPPILTQLTPSIQAYTRTGQPASTNATSNAPMTSISALSQFFSSLANQVNASLKSVSQPGQS